MARLDMNKAGYLILLIAFAISTLSYGQAKHFTRTNEIEKAYHLILDLRLEEAQSILDAYALEDPNNGLIPFVENYIDFFTIFIGEEKEEFKSLEANKSRRLEQIQKGDPNSPYFLFTQAEIKLQWALARLKFEEYFTAFTEVRSAHKLLEKNQKRFPTFVANKKSLGILHALVGTLPDNYQWGVRILGGIPGDISGGQREIEEVLSSAGQQDFLFEKETKAIYALLLLHLTNSDKAAWKTINTANLNPKESPLAAFIMANVALHVGKTDVAIKLLEGAPQDDKFLDFAYLDYMLGLSYLYKGDNRAVIYLKSFLDKFNGINYKKEACQKIAWFYLLKEDLELYRSWMEQVQKVGATIIDGDQAAMEEAVSEIVPEKTLLRARLYFDGHYLDLALQTLQNLNPYALSRIEDRIQYYYRLARIYHALGNYDKAIKNYELTYKLGKDNGAYYACSAQLNLGLIRESLGQKSPAADHFKICLSLKPSAYKNSLHQKAKAGLNRLK